MDLETALRKITGKEDPVISAWINNEGRVMIAVRTDAGTDTEFVVVGDNALPWPIEVPKPVTQKMSVGGIDAYGAMGTRP